MVRAYDGDYMDDESDQAEDLAAQADQERKDRRENPDLYEPLTDDLPF